MQTLWRRWRKCGPYCQHMSLNIADESNPKCLYKQWRRNERGCETVPRILQQSRRSWSILLKVRHVGGIVHKPLHPQLILFQSLLTNSSFFCCTSFHDIISTEIFIYSIPSLWSFLPPYSLPVSDADIQTGLFKAVGSVVWDVLGFITFIPKLSHIIFHPAISAVSAKPKLNKIPPTDDSLSPELLTI